MFIIKFYFFLLIFTSALMAESLNKCHWNNKNGIPCTVISKTPNTSKFSEKGVNKIIISKQEIESIGAIDINDVLKGISGLDVFQSGGKGQTTSVFTRGSESNHTLVMMNGIAITDQSLTDGLHDFGQDFIHNIEMIEIYKGSNGAHFGPSAIAGAINFITSIDYVNNYSFNGFNGKNNSSSINYTKITDKNWHLNLKSSATFNETGSAIADGNEYDGSENFQINFNGIKWINDNLKFKSTLYSRKTIADYDGSATDEENYVADNRMHTIQSKLEHVTGAKENDLTFHYHNYDRKYENSGYLDEYFSESFVIKAEAKNNNYKTFSYGYGSEYKYDWGHFENRGSYTASTKGYVKNLGTFGNIGYKINDKVGLSVYGRSDNHKTTGNNNTYKINLTKIIKKFNFSLTHATGLRNPTLYELYGTDNYGITGNLELNPEKSKTNELNLIYDFSPNLKFNSTAFKSKVFDQIETNSSYTQHENQLIDINQEGLENEIKLKNINESYSIYNTFSKSRKTNGQAQSRRPDISYGMNYKKEKIQTLFGLINLNLNYKHTGEYVDWNGTENAKQKSTDIVNLSIIKNLNRSVYFIKLSNLLNERYEKPATYSQDGINIRVGFKNTF